MNDNTLITILNSFSVVFTVIAVVFSIKNMRR